MIRSEFQGDYGDLIPDGLYDREVAALIAQMGDNPAKPQPGVQAIAVFLANRYKVMSLGDLQFLWTPDSQECGGNDEAYNCTYIPGFFTAIVKHNDLRIPQEFAHFDDGKATYYLGFKPTANGQPGFGLLYVNPRARGVFREVALPLLAIGSMVFDWSGTLGTAILGAGDAVAGAALAGEVGLQVGLTGTQVAQIVGSSAAGAVTSGGDPVKAIENAAASFVGAQAGNFVGAAVDSAAAQKLATAAVSAAARGEDVGRAILTTGATTAAGAVASAITSGSTMDDILFPGETVSIPEYGYDWQFAPGDTVGDVVVSLDELGITGDILIDDAAAAAVGVDQNATYFNDDGEEVDSFGQTVGYTAETFAVGFNLDEKNNILGPDNRVIITREDVAAILAANEAACNAPAGSWKTMAGLGAVCLSPQQAIANEVQRRIATQTNRTVIPGTGSNYRPANIPPPNPNGVKMPDAVGWAAAGEAITKSVANMLSIIKQVENGTYRPGATSPYGTPRPPVPGFPVTNRDGSVVVNNGNGTQTVTYPNGTRTTMSTSTAGAGTFGGVSTNTLLIAGAGLAALLLLRRK
jgi:hypothetical protein